MTKTEIPQFKNEREEAQWWFENRARISADVVAASKSGAVGEGSRARRLRKEREQAHEQARPSAA